MPEPVPSARISLTFTSALTVASAVAADGQVFTRYDTSVPGNANTGHVYGTTLSDDDKRAVVEYLKTF